MEQVDRLVTEGAAHLLEATMKTAGEDFFRALVKSTAEVLGTRWAFVGELLEDGESVRSLAMWADDHFVDGFQYELADTPCASIFESGTRIYEKDVQKTFPRDLFLQEMGVESYFGIPVVGRDEPVGIFAVLHDAPHVPPEAIVSMLGVFAARVAVEVERRDALAHLEASEQRYRRIVTSCIEGIWTLDENHRIVFVNQQLASTLGYTVEEILGRTPMDFVPDAFKADIQSKLARRRDGIAERFEVCLLGKNGSEVWLEVSASPSMDATGNYHGATDFFTDITERRLFRERIVHAQKLESLGMLAGGVAHDFNNLLVGILGNIGLSLRSIPEGSPARQTLADAETAGRRAAELTQQMLAHSGKGHFAVGPVNLNLLVGEMNQLIGPAVSRLATISYEFGEDLPLVSGDATQLRQVVLNLITNASDSLGDSGGAITIQTRSVEVGPEGLESEYLEPLGPGRYVSLEVRDTGCGMSEETKAKLFDPFFTTKFTGRGLGLASVMGILRGHKATITVDTEVARGTTFRVFFPVCSDEAISNRRRRKVEAMRKGRSARILMADDEKAVRGIFQQILENAGYTCESCADGSSAVEKFEADPTGYDLVILDLTMPRMSGEQAYREMKKQGEVNVLFCSGFGDTRSLSAEIKEGDVAFLPKPFTSDSLLQKVETCLGVKE